MITTPIRASIRSGGDLFRLGLAIMAVSRSIIRRSDTAEVPGRAGVLVLVVPMKGYLRIGAGRPQFGEDCSGLLVDRREVSFSLPSARDRFSAEESRRKT